jgi:hypothetical protein
MMTDVEHSKHYAPLRSLVEHPNIKFPIATPPNNEIEEIIKEILHSLVAHHFLHHDLTEVEHDELHQLIEERNYSV